MKMFEGLSKKTKIGIVVSIVLCVILLINSVAGIVRQINGGKLIALIHACLSLVVALITIWYALIGYKKPHGNSLRFAYFIFSLAIGLRAIADSTGSEQFGKGVLLLIAALILAYISGRLNKIEKNKKLLLLVGILFFADAIISIIGARKPTLTLFRITNILSSMAFLFAFGLAYIARYEAHKEAGIEDGPKVK